MSRLAGRSAAVFLGGASALVMLTTFLPDSLEEYEYDENGVRAVAMLGLFIAAVAVLLPWERWPRRASLALPILGLGILLLGAELGEVRLSAGSVLTFASLYFVIVAWVGITQPRGTALVLAPFVVGSFAYVLATLPTDGNTIPVAALVITIPAGTLISEGIAYVMESLRQSQILDLDRVNDLEALADAVSGLRHGASMEEAAALLGTAANRIFHGDHVTTVLRATDGRLVPSRVGAPGNEPGPQATSLVRQAIADGEVALVAEDGDTTAQLLVIPLVGLNTVGGAILVRLPEDEADPFRLHLARLFSGQAGGALEQLRVIESLSQDARRDELTGLGNRRHALDLLESLQSGDAVVLVDLDRFKDVNDTDGHAAGDALLRSLGDHLRSCVRDDDLVARLGGDEFILVARSAEADAIATVNRILTTWRGSLARTSFSAGVAVHRRDDPPAITLEHADIALYRAKQRGRDQVQVYQPVG